MRRALVCKRWGCISRRQKNVGHVQDLNDEQKISLAHEKGWGGLGGARQRVRESDILENYAVIKKNATEE